MNIHFKPGAIVSALLLIAATQENFGNSAPQADPSLNLVGDAMTLRWQGVDQRTYFLRTSSDLLEWDFIPEIEHGEGDFHYGFESTTSDLYLQLLHTDDLPLVNGEVNPEEFDFDGDGLPSLHELLLGLNPLEAETVAGILDGSGDREMDGRIDGQEMSYPLPLGPSHPSRIDNPKVKLVVRVLR